MLTSAKNRAAAKRFTKTGKWGKDERIKANIQRGLTVLLLLMIAGLTASGQGLNRERENALLLKLKKSVPDTNRVVTLIDLGKFHLYKQAKSKPDLDSAHRYLAWAKRLSDTLRNLEWQHQSESMLVLLWMNKGQSDSVHVHNDLLMKDCARTHDWKSEADARFRYGMFLTSNDTGSREGLENLLKSAELYRSLKDKKKETRVRYEVAFIHFNEGKSDLAESELLDVARKYQAIHSGQLQYAYNLLGTLFRIKGDFNKGLKYAILSIETMNKTKDTVRAAYFFGDLARIYMEVGDHRKAIEWYNKAVLKWRQQRLAEFGMYLAQGYIIKDLISKNKSYEALIATLKMQREIPPVSVIQKACMAEDLAYCYDALMAYAVAEKYYLEAIQLYDQSKMNFEVPQEAIQAIGKFYIERASFSQAGLYLRRTLLFSPQKLSVAAISDIHYMLFKVDSAEKNYLSAIDHYRLHKALNDSLFNRTKIREIEQLQIQFETVKKDREFKLLNNQSKLQEAKLQQAQQTQKVTFGAIALFLLIFALMLNQFRLKQRSNKQLKSQQIEISSRNTDLQNLVVEKEWLVKEIHHRVKNNLHTIVSLMESQSRYLGNDALEAVRDSQHRIHAMSLIHQKLYLTDNLSSINMSVYIRELTGYLRESFQIKGDIYFELAIDPIILDVSVAIPIGLILNEAITNSLKYAFEKNGGVIKIDFTFPGKDYLLIVTDNGLGLPPDFIENQKVASLGMTLMRGLCKEIGAEFDIKSDHGTIVSVRFPQRTFKVEFS